MKDIIGQNVKVKKIGDRYDIRVEQDLSVNDIGYDNISNCNILFREHGNIIIIGNKHHTKKLSDLIDDDDLINSDLYMMNLHIKKEVVDRILEDAINKEDILSHLKPYVDSVGFWKPKKYEIYSMNRYDDIRVIYKETSHIRHLVSPPYTINNYPMEDELVEADVIR